MASQPIPSSSCTLFFSWHRFSQKVFLRFFRVGSLSFFRLLVWSLPAVSQDPASSAPQTAAPEAASAGQGAETLSSPPPASFNDVMDRVVQREHLFLAQMRHMRPLVE